MSSQEQTQKNRVPCKMCYSTGVIQCFNCGGTGMFKKVTYGFTTSTTPCKACGGSGIKKTCEHCEGKGYKRV